MSGNDTSAGVDIFDAIRESVDKFDELRGRPIEKVQLVIHVKGVAEPLVIDLAPPDQPLPEKPN